MLSATLTVRLAGDRCVAASFASNSSRCQDHIDCAEAVLHAVTVVFNAARVEQETGFRLAPPFCRPPNCAFRDAGDFSRLLWVPCADMFSQGFESHRVLIDEVVVEPVIFDHQMQNSIEESNVSSRLDGQEQVTSARNRCNARINDDYFRAKLPRLPHIVGGYRRAF